MKHHQLTINTSGRGTIELTQDVQSLLDQSQVKSGLCHLFCQHTSASLILCENYDPDVLRDLEYFMSHQVEDGHPAFHHQAEGPDDMPAHIRTILTHSYFSIPLIDGRLALGTWQGIFLWEHRHHAHTRNVIVSIVG